jgi:hypothetical protein
MHRRAPAHAHTLERLPDAATGSPARLRGGHADQDLFPWLPPGPARDLLDTRSPDIIQATEEYRAQQIAQQQREEAAETTTKLQHQQTIRTSRNINAIINACQRLQKEHWPELPTEQSQWLAATISDTLASYDLATTIIWTAENQWTHPWGLNPLLHLTDYYNLHLANDVPIVLALRSWPDDAISKYYQREGFTLAAQDQLAELLRNPGNNNITNNVLSFLRQASYDAPAIREILNQLALDVAKPSQVRTDALERLAGVAPATDTLLTLATDQ